MTDHLATRAAGLRRRAGRLRDRAHQLNEIAEREPRHDRRRHVLDLAATYARAADELAPAVPAEPSSETLNRRHGGLWAPAYGRGGSWAARWPETN